MKRIIIYVLFCAVLSVNAFAEEKKETVPEDTSEVIVEVGNEKITHNRLYDRLRRIYGTQVLDLMVNESLIVQEGKKNKIKVKDDVDEKLDEIKKTFDSEEKFNAYLQAKKVDLDAWKYETGLMIMRDKLIEKEMKIKVSKKEIEEFFEKNKEKLGVPASVSVSSIMLLDKKEAEDVAVSIKAGADFTKMVLAKSKLPNAAENKGFIGTVTQGSFSPQLDKLLFQMNEGDITVPIELGGKYYIFKIDKKNEVKEAELDKAMKARIKESLRTSKINSSYSAWLQKIKGDYIKTQ